MMKQLAENTRSQRKQLKPSDYLSWIERGWFLRLLDGRFVLGWGASRWSNSAPLETALYAPDFQLSTKHPWLVSQYWDCVGLDDFAAFIQEGSRFNQSLAGESPTAWCIPEAETFFARVKLLQELFQTTPLCKGVPIVLAKRPGCLSRLARPRLLTRLWDYWLTHQMPTSFPYGYWDEEAAEGIIGITPELLFAQRSPQIVETFALAGTKPRDGRASLEAACQELLSDEKELNEHQIVVDDLRQVLREWGKVQEGEKQVMVLPHLLHLYQPLWATCSSLSNENAAQQFVGWVKRLHPTPALGLAPRSLGLEAMQRWGDLKERQRFGAPFGAIIVEENGRLDLSTCLVAIRNVQWQDDELCLGSGCGIIAASQPEKEWRELEAKRESVRRMLGL